jgi:hypothetical protein
MRMLDDRTAFETLASLPQVKRLRVAATSSTN